MYDTSSEGKQNDNLYIHSAVALCVAIPLLLQLLLFVKVCRMVNLLLCFIESDSSVFFLFTQTQCFFMYPLAVLSHLWPRFAYYSSNHWWACAEPRRASKSPVMYV